ncbi:MAG: electron transfer flavoprotein subunit alpha/FixB family protein [Elusimicrobia bacterium]|nr:electron transfer flavoprotein subunit alpha/FixB family protein [Elusimicrobiota bacterium]
MPGDYNGNGIWCIAEIRHGALVPTIYELLTAGRGLATALGQPLCAVVIGGPGKASQAATAVAPRGADKVYVVEHAALDAFLDEAYGAALKGLIEKERPAKVLFSASAAGRSLAARVSVLCGGGLASDVTEVSVNGDKHLQALRPVYAGNLISQVSVRRGPEMATVRPMAYSRSEAAGKTGEVVPHAVDPSAWNLRSKVLGFTPEESKEIDLSSAERIVSGGRGLGNPKGFELIRELAHSLGAAVGASRAAVDSGWIPYRHQVGLTGRTVRPRLYVACGISGQIQHLAGMSSSDFIVAINSDPEAPLMKIANLAVEGDLYQIIPAVIAEIQKQRGEAGTPAAAAH